MGQKNTVASLEIELLMATSSATADLARFGGDVDRTSADAIKKLDQIDAAMKGIGGDLSAPTAKMVAFAEETARTAVSAARDFNRIEKAGESLSGQLDRQIGTYGKTTAQIRAMKVESAAAAAEGQKQFELAARLRAQEAQLYDMEYAAARRAAQAADALAEERAAAAAQAVQAAEREAQAMREAAFAHGQFEAAARRGMQALREHEAAVEQDAATLARLRAMIDPVAAAQDRLNTELEQASRVMRAAGASEAELGRAHQLLTERTLGAHAGVTQLDGGTGRLIATGSRGAATMTQLSFQLNDVATMAALGAKPMQIFASQAGQIFQIAQMAEGGVKGFANEVGALALRFAPAIVAAGVAAAGLGLFVRWVNEGVTNDQLTKDLGKITGGANATKQELYKLRDATVTWGDVTKALFSVVGKDIAEVFVGDMKGMAGSIKVTLDDLTSFGRTALAGLYAATVGMKAYMGEISSAGGLMKALTGDPTLFDRTIGKAYRTADKYLGDLGNRTRKEAIENARERNAATIGFNTAPKAKVDQAALNAEAVEAQIRNLYKLADAYGVSGAAALLAEARVKAESAAIKARGDIEVAVAREVRLAVAQRVADAAKGAAATRDQARVQAEVNGMVAAGNIPAERAAELIQDRIADLTLLAALEAATKVADAKGIAEVTKALEAQRSARVAIRDANTGTFFNDASAAAEKQIAVLREELRLVGASDAERVRALATIRATQALQAAKKDTDTAYARQYIAEQVEIAEGTQKVADATRGLNEALTYTADKWDIIAGKVQSAAGGMADAFGGVGRAIGDMAAVYATYQADQERAETEHRARITEAGTDQVRIARETQLFALRSSGAQIEAFGDMASAAKGFFKEGSSGYQALAAAEKVYRVAQFAMSLQAVVQNAAETFGFVSNSAAKATAAGAEGVANQSKLPFPFNIAAMAATGAALVAAGIAVFGGGGGGGRTAAATNTGTGSVLGDNDAQSESIKRSIDALHDVDTLMLTASRGMAASLRSIDNQIGGLASVLVRSGEINASGGVAEGFKTNAVGSVLKAIVPVFGSALASLFGTKTTVTGSGLYGGAQSVGDILNGGFDASTYSDVEKKKKLFGITTSTKTSTQYADADAGLENQFTLVLRSFNDAIRSAAGPLGIATGDIESRLNGFVVNIGKIDLQGLTGTEIQEKLEAVFGAAADGMAEAAMPGVSRFQRAGEGAFETLVRVASTLESVTSSLDLLGASARAMGIDAKLGLADQFDSIGDLTGAIDGYFSAFYTEQEQSAARAAQMGRVFDGLGVAMPETLASFRQLVEAQDLTTAAGQSTYATLLQLAPAFADLKSAMDSAKSAADVMAERQDLERKMLELRGDTAAIRALDLAKLDASNRGLQEQIYAVQDAQEAAKAAERLRDAWTSVGDGIMDEVKRIRGLTGAQGGGSFAVLMGQFNAANSAARGGDQDAAKTLPGLSQALLKVAADVASSRQELERVQAATAASLEATYGVIGALGAATSNSSATMALSTSASQAASMPASASSSDTAAELRALREEIAGMREDNNAGQATIAGNVGRVAKKLDDVTAASGGDAITTQAAA